MNPRATISLAVIALLSYGSYAQGGTNEVVFTPVEKKGGTREVVFAAAAQGDVPRLKELFAADPNLISIRDDLLRTAAQTGQKDAVEFLILQGADVNAKGFFEVGPLAYIAMNGTNDQKCAEVATLLLARGAEVDPVDRYGATPLLHAVEMHKVQVARVLLEHGANPERPRDGTRLTPLIYAVRQRHYDMVELLLEHKASGDILDPDGNMSLLVWAIRTQKHDLARLLIEHGTPLTPPRTMPAAFWSATMINVDRRHPLEDFNMKHVPLMAAIQMRDADSVALMLKHKVSLDAVDPDGNAPLHWAVRTGNTNLVRLLLEAKAPVNATNYGGATPLLLAETTENEVLLAMLRQAAIDQVVSVPDSNVPSRDAMRAIARSICDGEPIAIDDLAGTVREFYRGGRGPAAQQQIKADRANAAFEVLGEEAGKGNANALRALKIYLGQNDLKWSAVHALGIAAAAGNEESLNLLLRYRDWKLLENSVAFALAPAAKANKQPAVDFFVTLALDRESVKHQYYGVGWLVKEVLETSATNGNSNAKAALDKFLAASTH
jgi:ankyrin repeat protein